MPSQVMCIGGPKHGETIALPRGGDVVTMVSPLDRYAVPVDDLRFGPPGFMATKHELYTRLKVRMGSKVVHCLRHESLSEQTAADVFLELLAWQHDRGDYGGR